MCTTGIADADVAGAGQCVDCFESMNTVGFPFFRHGVSYQTYFADFIEIAVQVGSKFFAVTHTAGRDDFGIVGSGIFEKFEVFTVVAERFVNKNRKTCFNEGFGSFNMFTADISCNDDGIDHTDHIFGFINDIGDEGAFCHMFGIFAVIAADDFDFCPGDTHSIIIFLVEINRNYRERTFRSHSFFVVLVKHGTP